MKTILVGLKPERISSTQHARLDELTAGRKVVFTEDQAEMETLLDEVEVAAAGVPIKLLLKAPGLRWYQQWGAGANWLSRYPAAVENDFVLTNVSGIHAIPISEHIFAFLLAFARTLPDSIRVQPKRYWLKREKIPVFELGGKTMLIVGLGPIGIRTAEIAVAFGMRVLGVRRNPEKKVPGIERIVAPSQLAVLLPEADFVVNAAPLTKETQGMFGEKEFQLMKESAYIFNIGRGGTIDEGAMIEALKTGEIAGAGLDVFEVEPLPEDSPLWEMDNVIITAHYSGETPYYNERAMEIFLDNLERYLEGTPLRNVVDKRLGY